MKTKKILAAIAALTIVFGAVPTQPFADVIGNMAITSSAETSEDDFEFSDGVILEYYGSNTEVVIPSAIDGVTVKSIGDSVFKLYYLLSLTFEENSQLESIGDSAFSGCSLKSITLPDSVTSIGYGAFFGCESLENITAPCRLKGNTSIGDAKNNCVTVTWSHVFAEDSAICECDEKVERYITGSCGENAAYEFDKATGTLTISGTGAIKESAFNVNSAAAKEKEFASEIKEVVVGDRITEIVLYAFWGCPSFTNV